MTLKKARAQWATRRRKYVVGYIQSGNCIFAKGSAFNNSTAADPMTLREARAFVNDMPSRGAAVFRLTPVAVGGGTK